MNSIHLHSINRDRPYFRYFRVVSYLKNRVCPYLFCPYLLGVLILVGAPCAFAQVYDAHTQVELVSNVETVAPDQPFQAAVRMKMDPGWHVYWKNSGDSGLPVSINWEVPSETNAPQIHWPVPQRFEEEGLTTYGYTQTVLFIKDITLPRDFAEPGAVLRARVDWLACERICVPGKADLVLNVPVSDTILPSAWAYDFEQTAKQWPQPSPWPISAFQNKEMIGLNVAISPESQAEVASLEFYPERNDIIVHSAPQSWRATPGGMELLIQKSAIQAKIDVLSGLLIVHDTTGLRRGFEVTVNKVPVMKTPDLKPASSAVPTVSLLTALLFAFIGGLILNLMPCVLPVLSIKVLSLIEHAQQRRGALVSGLVFALGVLVSCWFMAGLLIFLKIIGQQLGWGFQFQSPGFIIVLCMILFLFALNLWGAFEIGFLAPHAAGYINQQHKYMKAFFSGVLAMVLATPCTAPFMGTAIGFAITQNSFINILIFTFLGLGMALPYVLLSAFPQALKFVPKPGPWMNTFKKILALLLVGTIVWLVWILSFLAGAVTLMALAAGFLLAAIGVWVLGREQARGQNPWIHIVAVIFIISSVAVPLAMIETNQKKIVSSAGLKSPSAIQWRDYSPELMQQLAQEGKTVFLDFTAKWCVSCQVNERVALERKEVADKFRELGVVAVKADWTRFDARLTRALAELGKNSIPVYVIYYGENHKGMKVLPEIITPAIVLEALETVQ